ETALCPGKTKGEGTQARSPELQTHLCRRHQRPSCECCCRNRTRPLRFVSKPAPLQRDTPSIPSNAARNTTVRHGATRRRLRLTDRQERNHLEDRARWFDR